jgi:ABC-2 type transport system ATP-binding protein
MTQAGDEHEILPAGEHLVDGTLAELKQLLPPAQVEYVEKQPTLEEVFLSIVGADHTGAAAAADHPETESR